MVSFLLAGKFSTTPLYGYAPSLSSWHFRMVRSRFARPGTEPFLIGSGEAYVSQGARSAKGRAQLRLSERHGFSLRCRSFSPYAFRISASLFRPPGALSFDSPFSISSAAHILFLFPIAQKRDLRLTIFSNCFSPAGAVVSFYRIRSAGIILFFW